MQSIPIEVLGKRNFPDIELEAIHVTEDSVSITGMITLNSIIDQYIMNEDRAELRIYSASQAPVARYIEVNSDWVSTEESVQPDEIYVLSCTEEGAIWIEGLQQGKKVSLVVTDAEAEFRYLAQ